jgi:hypothetical protein
VTVAGANQNEPKPDAAKESDAAAQIAALQAQNEALQRKLDAAQAKARPSREGRPGWIVTYPAISLQPTDGDGKPVGDPVIINRGETLPPEFEAQGPFLRSIGHVTALQVPA